MKDDLVKRITLAHGNGGRLSHELYSSLIRRHFDSPLLINLPDSSVIGIGRLRLAFSTDSFVVKPLFFPGGDIGKLAVCGTVNDLSVMGARPLYLSCSLIIEDGLEYKTLDLILGSMAQTARECNVSIVTGDTKVVEHSSCDGIFINTAGIGCFDSGDPGFSPDRLTPGDAVIVTGTIGDHGMAILASREGFPASTRIKSDCAPLSGLIKAIIDSVPTSEIRVMRDPTRGGLATVLNELVLGSESGIEADEKAIPVLDEVRSLCEMAGYDPLYIANEGKAVIVVSQETAGIVLEILRSHPLGTGAAVIGNVSRKYPGTVSLHTSIGGERIVDMLSGDMFPRIC